MGHATIAMRAPTYLVLASMLGGPLHGAAIIERAAAMSGAAFGCLPALSTPHWIC